MPYDSIKVFNEILPRSVLDGFNREVDLSKVFEFRLCVGRRAWGRTFDGKSYFGASVSEKDVEEVVGKITGNTLYAYNDCILEGYLPYKGIRIGVSGTVVREGEKVIQVKEINALVIRIPHEIIGCSDEIFDEIYDGNTVKNTLIFSPPARGKTTILRDLARKLSINGLSVVVLDYKNELSAPFGKIMHMNVGESMVISNAPREWALERAIRNLSPDVIVTDEIYSPHEIDAIERAIGSGIKVIATMHADKMEHVPEFFDRYVALGSKIGAMKVIRHD